jgi:uncharacterized protein YcaQ
MTSVVGDGPYHPVVSEPIAIDRATARRFLVRRHLLAPPRSLPPSVDSVRAVVGRLGSLQFDPIDVTGRNHDLVLAARIDGYRRSWTDDLLYAERWLYETYNKGLSLVPTAELPWYRVTWDLNAIEHRTATFETHAELVDELLERIRRDGPMSATDVEPREAIDWYWRPTNQVRAILEALAEAGVLGLARRDGNRRVYDLAERLFPAALLDQRPSRPEQWRHKLLSRFRAHGLLGATGAAELWYGTGGAAERRSQLAALLGEGAIVPVSVEGVRGIRHVLAEERAMLEAEARASGPEASPGAGFLAPLDPFVWDRPFLRSLFDFDYVWEVYVPARKRRWGYYVLPILWGDRLVGRIEPRAERRDGTLRIVDAWWEAGFDPLDDPGFVDSFGRALVAHQAFLGMSRLAFPRAHRHRPFVAAVRSWLASTDRVAVAS